MSIVAKEAIVSHLESQEEFPIALSEVWEWLGYARKDHAVRAFESLELLQGEDFEVSLIKGENLKGGRPTQELRMTIDAFKGWSMASQTSKGKEVRRYYLQVEKEWKTSQSAIPQVTIDQVQAFQFQKDVFSPWISSHPVAGEIFLGWQGVQPVHHIEAAKLSNPSIDTQDALNGAFLNLNRSGLMMNKLFHFLDRIPTMKALDEDFVNELVNGLSESERLRVSLEDELSGALKRSRKLKEDYERTLKELRLKTMELDTLSQRGQTCESIPTVESPVYSGKVPRSLKPAT